MPRDHKTLHRLIEMLRAIPRLPRKISSQKIHEQLEAQGYKIGERSVQRDLTELVNAFPIVLDDRNKPYGWSWAKDAPTLSAISLDEAIALKLVEQFVSNLLPVSIADQLQPHFKAANNTLKNSTHLSSWTKKIRTVPPNQPLLPPAINPKVQQTIYEALLQDKQIKATYLKAGADTPKEYPVVNLLALVQRGSTSYLLVTFPPHEDKRPITFPLHRFQTAEILETSTKRPVNFDVDEQIKAGILGFGNSLKEIHLKVLLKKHHANHLTETRLSADQQISPFPQSAEWNNLKDDDWVKLTATVIETDQLHRWLFGFDDGVEILAPAELRRTFAEKAQNMAQLYR